MEINTKGLATKKREMSGRIYNFIFKEIGAFQKETGLSVASIEVSFENASSYDDEYPRFVISNVSVRLSPDL